MADKEFEVGDVVFVGPPAPLTQKATWRIESIRGEGAQKYAILSSGLTDRLRREHLARLNHFRLVENAS